MDALHQLPGKRAEEEVVEERGDEGAEPVGAGDRGTVDTHEEDYL